MSIRLIALKNGPSLALDKPILLVGRHRDCDVRLKSSKVSRRHCCIAQVHHYVIARDLASTNGIRINGVRVKEGLLLPGDELAIANIRYLVQEESAPGRPSGKKASPKSRSSSEASLSA